ncbi:hypothetical protein KR51_00014050 [Rubidibacter lacunae KORDI 51-2]|uniref:Uncharacterized protein n=1 Tax=Rubidibacter lacunae KORDI 51-2 TaxID=582515 RepID=U5DN72_9CHRO|nr:hypothetical protein KR51_00014050 [Rubidibacter lacunae KORDI 51-2]
MHPSPGAQFTELRSLAWIIHELLCGDPKPIAVHGLQTLLLNDSAFLYT